MYEQEKQGWSFYRNRDCGRGEEENEETETYEICGVTVKFTVTVQKNRTTSAVRLGFDPHNICERDTEQFVCSSKRFVSYRLFYTQRFNQEMAIHVDPFTYEHALIHNYNTTHCFFAACLFINFDFPSHDCIYFTCL